jgi:hypothetical protein
LFIERKEFEMGKVEYEIFQRKNKKYSQDRVAYSNPHSWAVKVEPFGFREKSPHLTLSNFYELFQLLLCSGSIFLKNLDSPIHPP